MLARHVLRVRKFVPISEKRCQLFNPGTKEAYRTDLAEERGSGSQPIS